MNCILCGADIPPLSGGSDTRVLSLDGIGFAACAKHFPADGASEAEYQAVYERFINAALKSTEIELPGASLFSIGPDEGPGHGGS